jgi:hypothetical protein
VTFVLWLAFLLAGMQAVVPENPFLCTEPSPPPRSPTCATISGVVVRGSSNTGIPNAHVFLEYADSGANAEALMVVADSNGRFVIPSINPIQPPAGYNVRVEADGYLPTLFGQIGVNAVGELINFPGSLKRRDLRIAVNPYPTASGTVRTSDFQPLAATLVRAYEIQYTPIGRRLKIAKTTLTNDLGDYRLVWISPRDYYVSASYNEDARALPTAGLRLTPNLSNPDSGYITTFYPSAPSSSNGAAFTVTPLGEKTNLNIVAKDTERFKVKVHVFSKSTLENQNFNVALLPAGSDLGDAKDYAIKRAGESDFEVRGVGVGYYSLVAFDKSRILSEAVPITVDHDLEVKITTYDALDIPGTVADEFGNRMVGKLRVRLVRTDPELGQTVFADVDSGNFLIQGMGPGAYDVYVDGLPKGTYIKDVHFLENERRFGRIRIEPDNPPRVQDLTTQGWNSKVAIQVVIASTDAAIAGIVWTGAKKDGVPVGVPGAQVVLVPDRSPTNPYAQREDRFVLGNTDSGGHFRLNGVPPGNYVAYGFVEIEPGLYFDPQFNDRISDLGIRVKAELGKTFQMTQCAFSPPPEYVCILRVTREKSYGVEP